MKRAIRQCIKITGGVMVFDLVHIENNQWWDAVHAALTEPEPPPSATTGS